MINSEILTLTSVKNTVPHLTMVINLLLAIELAFNNALMDGSLKIQPMDQTIQNEYVCKTVSMDGLMTLQENALLYQLAAQLATMLMQPIISVSFQSIVLMLMIHQLHILQIQPPKSVYQPAQYI